MPTYGAIAYTSAVRAAQSRMGSPVALSTEDLAEQFTLGPSESAFIAASDSFYQATVGESGWPYLQYRGGPPGFVQVLSPSRIGYADLRGNRQYISVGNLSVNPRVALFFIDLATRRRLKLYGYAATIEGDPIVTELAAGADRGNVERAVVIDLVAGSWNCPQHIAPRWTAEQIAAIVEPLQARIAELEYQRGSVHE